MADQPTDQAQNAPAQYRFLIVFQGSGYAAEAMAHVVSELEGRGHDVALVSYLGLATEAARSVASAGMRGLKAAVRTVTGRLTGEDPLGLESEAEARRDVVVATAPDLVSATGVVAKAGDVRVGLMTDLGWSPDWVTSDSDALVMPHPTFREVCLRKGWREDRVKTAGVPLPKPFCRKLDGEEIRTRFGLDPAQGQILMVVAEGVDHHRLDRLMFQVSLVDRPVQPIFYTGDDSAAATTLRKAAGKYGVMARMFGRVDNLEEFYAACDLVLAEVSNPLIYPLLALDKPVVLFDTDIDTRPVGAFLRDEGAAVLMPDVLRLGAELEGLLNEPDELARLRDGARAVVDQEGAIRVADVLEAIAKDREALLSGPRQTPGQSQADNQMSGGGAFEVIGSADAPPTSTGSSHAPAGGGPAAPPASFEPPSHAARLTAAEAKDALAELILEERRVDNKLSETSRFVAQWEQRLDLAQSAGEAELAREAEPFLKHYQREEAMLIRELDRIRAQKDKLKSRVVRPGARRPGGGSGGPPAQDPSRVAQLEGRFRAMEIDRDLERLKSRLQNNDD